MSQPIRRGFLGLRMLTPLVLHEVAFCYLNGEQ